MSNAINSKSVPLSSIFDLYQAGTTKARASGIDDAGTDTSDLYANIIYGSATAATGISSENADLNTLYAAKGTASYALPINGQTFIAAGNAASGHAVRADVSFQINTSGWTVVLSGTGSSPVTKASGPMPSGASTIQITATWAHGSGDTDAGTVNNTCASYTAIPATGTVGCDVAESNEGSFAKTTYTIVISMKSAGGNVISTTTCTFSATTSTG